MTDFALALKWGSSVLTGLAATLFKNEVPAAEALASFRKFLLFIISSSSGFRLGSVL